MELKVTEAAVAPSVIDAIGVYVAAIMLSPHKVEKKNLQQNFLMLDIV
jgi:hypothetical protein